MTTIKDQVRLFRKEMELMNKHIKCYGRIQKSSPVIKHWHTLNNLDWLTVLTIAKGLDQEGSMPLKDWTLRDIDKLVNHITNYESHCDNLLYPEIAVTKTLHHKLTNFDRTVTVKSITFKTMMNLREAYCKMKGIELPNDDSSKGKLDPKPIETLFE